MTSQIIGFSKRNEQGEMMGILASIMSLSMILGPLIGGAVYEIYPSLPFIIAGIILLITFIFVYNIYKHVKQRGHLDIPPIEAI